MCTNLSVLTGTKRGPLVTARTMDETPEIPCVVQLVPAGTKFGWGTSTIPFVAVGCFADPLDHSLPPVMYGDGMNVHGLSAGALWLPDTKHQTGTTNTIGGMQVCGWVLGSFKTVAEVLQGLQTHTIVESTRQTGALASLLHWVFTDAQGNVLIAEYVNGALNTYIGSTNPNDPNDPSSPYSAVLTNSPPYDWQRKNVSNAYTNLTVRNVATQIQGQDVNGSGMLGAPGDATPPSRFVRSWAFTQGGYVPDPILLPCGSIEQYWVNAALQMLQTEIVPYGSILTSAGALGDHSQWGTVRDHQNLAYYFFTAFNSTLFKVDLNSAPFGTGIKGIPVKQPNWFTPAVFS